MAKAASEPRERRCVTGDDPDKPFPIPFFSDEFQDAPELERIGRALIEACDEFQLLKWAMDEGEHQILYVWKKKAGKSADRVKAGTLAKAAGLVKHLSDSAYVVTLARDVNYGATYWQMEALVYHELKHIKVEEQLVGKGEDKVAVPNLKVRAHDLEMFDSEIERYGLWRADLKRAQPLFAQAPLFADNDPKRTNGAKPTAADHLANLHAAGATVSANGRELTTEDDVRDHLRESFAEAGIATE